MKQIVYGITGEFLADTKIPPAELKQSILSYIEQRLLAPPQLITIIAQEIGGYEFVFASKFDCKTRGIIPLEWPGVFANV